MGKSVAKAGAIIAGVALIATGVGAAAGVGLLGAAAASVAASAGTLTLFGVSVSAIAQAGLALQVVGSLTTKRPEVQTGGNPVQQTYDPQSGIPYPMGRTAVGGRIIYGTVTGPASEGNKYRLFYSVLSGVRVAAIEQFYSNDEAVNFTVNGGEGASGTYLNRMWQVRRLGLPTDSYLRFVATGSKDTPADHGGNPPEWTPAHTLPGMACALTACEYDTKIFTSDVKPLWVLRGAHVYDPRLDSTYPGGSGACRALDETTYVYSENPWLHALTWALGRYQNGKRILGIGAAVSALILPQFVEAANVADANGWKIGGTVYSTDEKWAAMRTMAQAGGGDCVPMGAQIGCIVNAPRVSLATVTTADLVGEISVAGTKGRRDRINGVIPRYRSEDHNWETISALPIVVAAHVAEDRGIARTREIDYPLVQNLVQLAQLARYDEENSREFEPVILRLGPAWLGYRPGDCITVSSPEVGLNGQDVLITKRSFDPATAIVTLECRSETHAKHAFALGQTTTAPPIPTLTGVDLIPAAPQPGNAEATGTIVATAAGSLPVAVIKLVIDSVHASSVIVDYRQVFATTPATYGDWASQEWPVSSLQMDDADDPQVTLELKGLAPGGRYQIHIRYRTVRGNEDPDTYADLGEVVVGGVDAGTVGGKTTAQIVADAEATSAPAIAAAQAAATAAQGSANTALSNVAAEILRAQGAEGTLSASIVSLTGTVNGNTSAISAEGLTRQTADTALSALITSLTSTVGANKASADSSIGTLTTDQAATAARTATLESKTVVAPNLMINADGADPISFNGWPTNSGFGIGYSDTQGSFFAALANPTGSSKFLASVVYPKPDATPLCIGLSGDAGTSVGAARGRWKVEWMAGPTAVAATATFVMDVSAVSWTKRAEIVNQVPPTGLGIDGWRFVYEAPAGHDRSLFSLIMANVGTVALPYNNLAAARDSQARLAVEQVTRSSQDTALSALITSLTGTVGANKASADSSILALSNDQSALASSVNGLKAASSVNPNLVQNGGAQRGFGDWIVGSGVVQDLAGPYGPRLLAAANGQAVWSPAFSATAGVQYTASAGLLNYPAGYCQLFINWFTTTDGTGSGTWSTVQVVNSTGGTFARAAITRTAPAGAQSGRLYWYAVPNGEPNSQIRQVKVEEGAIATLWSDDASVRSLSASYDAEVVVRTSADAALAASDTSLASAISGNTAAISNNYTTLSGVDSSLALSLSNLSATTTGLSATVTSQGTAIVDVAGKVAAGRFVLSTAAGGGKPNRFTMYSDSLGTNFMALEAANIYFGDNTVFDDATDTLRTVTGSVARVIAWGAVFGASGANLLEWIGDSAVALGSMSKANAYYYTSTTAPYVGGSGLPSGGSTDAVLSKIAEVSNILPNSSGHAQQVYVDMTGVLATDLIEAMVEFSQEAVGALPSGAAWHGGWELIEETTSGGSIAVLASGTVDALETGGGFVDLTTSPEGFITFSGRSLTGAVRYALRVWKTGGTNLGGSGIHALIRVRRTP